MTNYTIQNDDQVSILADGFKVITAANSQGKAVLLDFFYNFLNQLPASNSLGITLKYIEQSRTWITPDGAVCLFNVSDNMESSDDIKKLLKQYGKSKNVQRTVSSPFGYLATDSGMPITIQENELLEVAPQPLRKCGTDFYLTSKMYPTLNNDGFTANTTLDDSLIHTILNSGYNSEELAHTINISGALINNLAYTYTHNPTEKAIVSSSITQALISTVLLPPYTQPEIDKLWVAATTITNAMISMVVLPVNTSPPEAISVVGLGVQLAAYGNP